MKETTLRFKVPLTGLTNPNDLVARFSLGLTNSTEWRGKESESCRITEFNATITQYPVPPGPTIFDLTVVCRPKRCITYKDGIRWDGWTQMTPKRSPDGTYLNDDGKPLEYGQRRAYVPVQEMKGETDFNQLDLGEFQGEVETPSVKHIKAEELQQRMQLAHTHAWSTNKSFVVPRQTPNRFMIALSHHPTCLAQQPASGDYMIVLNNELPQLDEVLLDNIENVLIGYFEGRIAIDTSATENETFVELSKILIDTTPNQYDLPTDTDLLNRFLPAGFLDELSERLMSVYKLEITVVDGKQPGFLVRRTEESVPRPTVGVVLESLTKVDPGRLTDAGKIKLRTELLQFLLLLDPQPPIAPQTSSTNEGTGSHVSH